MDKETLKFIVLADLHIVPEGELSNSLDTNARLIQSIEFINKNPNKNQKIRIGILSLNQSIPRNNNNIYNNQNRLIVKVTSVSYSPTLKKPKAMGLVEEKYDILGN